MVRALLWFISWWRHQMETFSALLAICAGNSPVTGEFPTQRPVTRSFDVFFDLRVNKRLSKQSRGWWFETPSCSLWRHCNAKQQPCRVNSLALVQSYEYTRGVLLTIEGNNITRYWCDKIALTGGCKYIIRRIAVSNQFWPESNMLRFCIDCILTRSRCYLRSKIRQFFFCWYLYWTCRISLMSWHGDPWGEPNSASYTTTTTPTPTPKEPVMRNFSFFSLLLVWTNCWIHIKKNIGNLRRHDKHLRRHDKHVLASSSWDPTCCCEPIVHLIGDKYPTKSQTELRRHLSSIIVI